MSSFLVLMSSFISMATCWGSTESSSRSCSPVAPCYRRGPEEPPRLHWGTPEHPPPTNLLPVLALEVQPCLDVAAGLLEGLALRHLGRVMGADPDHIGAQEDQGVGDELGGAQAQQGPPSSATLLCTPQAWLWDTGTGPKEQGDVGTQGHKGPGQGEHGRPRAVGDQGRRERGRGDPGWQGTDAAGPSEAEEAGAGPGSGDGCSRSAVVSPILVPVPRDRGQGYL